MLYVPTEEGEDDAAEAEAAAGNSLRIFAKGDETPKVREGVICNEDLEAEVSNYSGKTVMDQSSTTRGA